MEEDVFLRPAVAGLLKSGFIESRIHVDIPSYLTDEEFARNKALQAKLAKTPAMPTFVMVDPNSRDRIGLFQLGSSPAGYESGFVDFLERMQAKRRGDRAEK